MKCFQIVFSPTGGTKKVADIISEEFKMPVEFIDLSKTNHSDCEIKKEDLAVIAVPSYGGRIPELASQRLAEIQGNQSKCIIVCVYGNRAYEDTLIELYDIAKSCDFKVVAAISAVAEHSIIHQYAAGRPDKQDKEQLHNFSKTIYEKIKNNKISSLENLIPGNRPYKKAAGVGLVPKTDKKCVNCGLCAKDCPAQAINKENFKITDSKKCISCMRCVVKCPESARKVNGAMVNMAALALKKACTDRKENELF